MADLPEYLYDLRVKYKKMGSEEIEECSFAELISDGMADERHKIVSLAILPLFNKSGKTLMQNKNPYSKLTDLPNLISLATSVQFPNIPAKLKTEGVCPSLTNVYRIAPQDYKGEIAGVKVLKAKGDISVTEQVSDSTSDLYADDMIIGEGTTIYSVVGLPNARKAKSSGPKKFMPTAYVTNESLINKIQALQPKLVDLMNGKGFEYTEDTINEHLAHIYSKLENYVGVLTNTQLDTVLLEIERKISPTISISESEITPNIDNAISDGFEVLHSQIGGPGYNRYKGLCDTVVSVLENSLKDEEGKIIVDNNVINIVKGIIRDNLPRLISEGFELTPAGFMLISQDKELTDKEIADLGMQALTEITKRLSESSEISADVKAALPRIFGDMGTIIEAYKIGDFSFFGEVIRELKSLHSGADLEKIIEAELTKKFGDTTDRTVVQMIVDGVIAGTDSILKLDDTTLELIKQQVSMYVASDEFADVMKNIISNSGVATADDVAALKENITSFTESIRNLATKENIEALLSQDKDGKFKGLIPEYMESICAKYGLTDMKFFESFVSSLTPDVLESLAELPSVVKRLQALRDSRDAHTETDDEEIDAEDLLEELDAVDFEEESEDDVEIHDFEDYVEIPDVEDESDDIEITDIEEEIDEELDDEDSEHFSTFEYDGKPEPKTKPVDFDIDSFVAGLGKDDKKVEEVVAEKATASLEDLFKMYLITTVMKGATGHTISLSEDGRAITTGRSGVDYGALLGLAMMSKVLDGDSEPTNKLYNLLLRTMEDKTPDESEEMTKLKAELAAVKDAYKKDMERLTAIVEGLKASPAKTEETLDRKAEPKPEPAKKPEPVKEEKVAKDVPTSETDPKKVVAAEKPLAEKVDTPKKEEKGDSKPAVIDTKIPAKKPETAIKDELTVPEPEGKVRVVKGILKDIDRVKEPKQPFLKRVWKSIIRHPLRSALIGAGIGVLGVAGVALASSIISAGGIVAGAQALMSTVDAFAISVGIGAGAGVGAVAVAGVAGAIASKFSKKGKKERLYAKFLKEKAYCDAKAEKIKERQAEQEAEQEKIAEMREKQRYGNKILKKIGIYKACKNHHRNKFKRLRQKQRKLETKRDNKVLDAIKTKRDLNRMEESDGKSLAMGGMLDKLKKQRNKLESKLKDPRIDELEATEIKEDIEDLASDAEIKVAGITKLKDDYKTFDAEAEELIDSVKHTNPTLEDIKLDIKTRNSERYAIAEDKPVYDSEKVKKYIEEAKTSKDAKHIASAEELSRYMLDLEKNKTDLSKLAEEGKISYKLARELMSEKVVKLDPSERADIPFEKVSAPVSDSEGKEK